MAETQHKCINCGSTDLVMSDDKQGFGAGKAFVGAVALGPLGLLAGAINKNKRHVSIRCNACLQFFTSADLIKKAKEAARPAPGFLSTVLVFFVVLVIGMALCSPSKTPAPSASSNEPTAAPASPDMARPAKAKRHKKPKTSDE